jgi:hypothetical protein
VAVASALVSFYVTYLAYRNLKSILPLLRPGELFDRQLADADRGRRSHREHTNADRTRNRDRRDENTATGTNTHPETPSDHD